MALPLPVEPCQVEEPVAPAAADAEADCLKDLMERDASSCEDVAEEHIGISNDKDKDNNDKTICSTAHSSVHDDDDESCSSLNLHDVMRPPSPAGAVEEEKQATEEAPVKAVSQGSTPLPTQPQIYYLGRQYDVGAFHNSERALEGLKLSQEPPAIPSHASLSNTNSDHSSVTSASATTEVEKNIGIMSQNTSTILETTNGTSNSNSNSNINCNGTSRRKRATRALTATLGKGINFARNKASQHTGRTGRASNTAIPTCASFSSTSTTGTASTTTSSSTEVITTSTTNTARTEGRRLKETLRLGKQNIGSYLASSSSSAHHHSSSKMKNTEARKARFKNYDKFGYSESDLANVASDDLVFGQLQRELRKRQAVTNSLLKEKMHIFIYTTKSQKEKEQQQQQQQLEEQIQQLEDQNQQLEEQRKRQLQQKEMVEQQHMSFAYY